MLSEEAIIRRNEEIAALSAYYDDDFQASLIIPSSSSSNTIKNSNSSNDDDDENSARNKISIEGPWFIKLGNNGYHHHHGLLPTLEIRLPNTYPCDGAECPVPILHNVIMKPELKNDLLNELQMMWEVDMDVGILWGERCREEICLLMQEEDDQEVDGGADELYCSTEDSTTDARTDDNDIQTFIPPTTRYNQPIRHFPTSIINNPKYRRTIIHTPPFHPPKSGPSENMIAHVCSVTCIEHVQWALAELLFNDKKVGKATHNMFAYRFNAAEENNDDDNNDNENEQKKKSTLLVKDNDDDGEKGSGAKLASLLELSSAENVLVVVSRWYGGQLLGPSRFKWIACVARNGLVQGGFIEE
ncbi:hypothetical protein ACHAWC_009338 [Mediolabrus comicus]